MNRLSLKLENVSLAYGDREVVHGVSQEVKSGEMLGVIGPNGCGKSTLIRGITRLVSQQGGRVSIGEREVGSYGREGLARLAAVVPQNAALPELFTAMEVVLMGRTPYLGRFRYESAADFETARRAMEAVGIGGLAERRTGELSGGEKQRVCIARALAQEPKILLLDEPTAHLDINHKAETLDLVRALCRNRGLAVLLALHDLNLAAQYCDRVVMMAGGRIFRQGAPAEVITEENIRAVFGAEVKVQSHPANGLPIVTITPDGRKAGEAERLLWKT
jgi:iron complex transport system ATP-binding protein